MKTASVSDLRYRFSKLESLLRQGEEVQIVKDGNVIARLILAPSQTQTASESRKHSENTDASHAIKRK